MSNLAAKLEVTINPTIQEQIYNIIWQDIIDGTFHEGEQLKEVELAERFNVSRSPVREALRRLAGDGLLIISPNRGIFVREFTLKYMQDFFELRLLFETRGIHNMVTQLNPLSERLLVNYMNEMERLNSYTSFDLDTHDRVDNDFHNIILSANNNDFIDEMINKMSAVSSMLRNLSLQDPKRAHESQVEHMNIITAILNKDEDEACSILGGHIERTQKRVTTVFNQRKLKI